MAVEGRSVLEFETTQRTSKLPAAAFVPDVPVQCEIVFITATTTLAYVATVEHKN